MMTVLRHLRRGALLALALTLLVAAPAAADPPGPTNYDARIVEIEPAVEGVEARVLGGDSFLQLSVAEGHEAVVRGYDGEELYLRFDANGEVYENRRASSYYQNQSRFNPNAADRPAELGADVPPDWALVSTTGTYAWHDHRIHWMSPTQLPFRAVADSDDAVEVDPALSEPQLTTVWAQPVPITVDGEQVGITGQLYYLPDASPVPAAVAAALGLAAILALGWRSPVAGILAGAGGGAVLATVVAIPQVVGLPAGVQPQPLQVVLPLIALLIVAAGLSVRARSPFATAVAGAGGLPLLAWAINNLGAMTAPIVPPHTWPDMFVRIAVGAVVGAAVGALVAGIRDLLTGEALSLDPGPEST